MPELLLRRRRSLLAAIRSFSRFRPPPPGPVIRVSNNVARLGEPKPEPKPRQLLSLPPFPAGPLPGKNPPASPSESSRVTAVSWVKYYFADAAAGVVQSHFNKRLVQLEAPHSKCATRVNLLGREHLRKAACDDVMEPGMIVHIPVSVAEAKISKRFDTIPTATLCPNADEIEYLQRLVMHKDSAILVLNKPPKVPVKVRAMNWSYDRMNKPPKGNLPVHNSMDALAAAALSYGNEEGPKLVHRLDRESSGILLMGRTKECVTKLHWLFTDVNLAKTSSKVWNDACEATAQRYWALVIGTPKEREGVINSPLSKVLLDGGKTERIMLSHPSGVDGSLEAITEYRVIGPTINGCSWVELRSITGRKHQLRVHCAEALGTPIVGDYKYGWYVHKRWKQMPRADYDPITGEPYKLRRPEGLDVQKGSVLSKVPLLHLHCRELILPNMAKFLGTSEGQGKNKDQLRISRSKPDVLRFVAPMPSHMKISWNLMSSYLV